MLKGKRINKGLEEKYLFINKLENNVFIVFIISLVFLKGFWKPFQEDVFSDSLLNILKTFMKIKEGLLIFLSNL